VTIAVIAIGLIAAACGGSSGSKTTSPTTSATATSESTTTSVVTGDTTVDNGSSTTVGTKGSSSSQATSASTVKGSTKTTSKTTAVAAKPLPAPILQVQGTTTTAQTGEQPKPGGTLRYATFVEIRGFDPILSTPANRSGDTAQMNAVFDSLMYQDLTSGDVVPEIAESMTSSDGITWNLKIRPNVNFSDGTPLNADAVKFNWQRLADPKNAASNAVGMASVVSVDVVDPLTLRITLKSVIGQFPRVVASNLTRIASPTALQAKGSGFASSPVGAGPFLVKDWLRNSTLTLVRNPNYWNAPRPFLDQVIISVIPDDEQRYNTFKTGAVDFSESGLNSSYIQRAQNDGYETNIFMPSGGNDFIFNTTRPPFNDVRVRKAIALSLDLNGLNQAVYNGSNFVPTTFFNPGSPFYDASLVRPEATGPKLSDAQAFIDQYGQPVKFTFLAPTTARTAYEYLQASVSKLKNVTVNIEVVDPTQNSPRLLAGDFDAGNYAFTSLDPEPSLYDQLHTGSSLNFGKYSSSDLDKALETGRSTLDPAARKQAYITVQQIMIRDEPHVYWARFIQAGIFTKKVGGMYQTSVGPMWDRMWVK
jgi:peptide/nickel transport system substrate-binding protein